jgi:hypothetical protein
MQFKEIGYTLFLQRIVASVVYWLVCLPLNPRTRVQTRPSPWIFNGDKNPQYEYTFLQMGSLTCRKILRHGADSFTSLSKEVVLRIFIAVKNPSSSAGYEPTNLGSNGKHANHETTEGD